MQVSRSSYLSLPSKPGVYFFKDTRSNILYVGKAVDLKARVSSYFSTSLASKTAQLISQTATIETTIVESEIESLLLEAFYIKKFRPKYNIRLTDGKLYPSIRITIKDKYPKVLLARKQDDSSSVYFGPFPHASAVKLVLKTIRRVFPFESVPNHAKRICLYHHLGLCPCTPVFDSPELAKEYKANIKRIIRILEGESKAILKELEKQRDEFSSKEKFEDAGRVQKQINALNIILQPVRNPVEYATNPNLRTDIRHEELVGLQTVLKEHGVQVLLPRKIECYDISNIQGTNATGSLVVFVSGEKDSSQYRRFKIKREATPNDFASMQEVLRRRFKRDGWEFPDLVIVDGGKGQVSAAHEVFVQMNIIVPLIGLAKRFETIVIPKAEKGSLGFEEVSLKHETPALQLLIRIRNEAHRFAITYHRKLRSKAMIGV